MTERAEAKGAPSLRSHKTQIAGTRVPIDAKTSPFAKKMAAKKSTTKDFRPNAPTVRVLPLEDGEQSLSKRTPKDWKTPNKHRKVLIEPELDDSDLSIDSIKSLS